MNLPDCEGCSVLGTHGTVVSTFSAALVASANGRAVLLAVAADGSVGSAANVSYGSSFTAPAGGLLPCDDGGRCVVMGKQDDGKAVASAWQLSGAGEWTDVSIPGGFLSATSVAQVVDLDGEQGIAVQDQGGGKTVWTVYAWKDSGYSAVGCAPVVGELDPANLKPATCLS